MVDVPAPSAGEVPFQRLVAERSPDIHAVVAVEGVYRFVSGLGLEAFGWRPEDLVGNPQTAFTHPDDVALVQAARSRVFRDPESEQRTVCRIRCRDGGYRWTEALSRQAEANGELLSLSAIRDLGERRKAELDLERQATTDPLTGVANRTVFMDRLQQALRRLDRTEGIVAVLFLDLDRFKLINDSVGHLMGDALLSQMAERLRAFLRPQDTLARLGGDEFAVAVEDMSRPDEAQALGARIIEAGRAPFQVGDDQFVCTTSVGIAVTGDAQHSAQGLLQEADLALYRAKDRGRDRAEVFDEDLRTRAVGRLSTERMLRRAIDEGRLRVEFQPIVELATGRTVAAEALVRVWDADQSALVAADSFIEVAEETGLLASMDDWVLAHAMQQATLWRDLLMTDRFGEVAVNVTARHLADAGFARSLIQDLNVHGLPTGSLQVELTERVLMEASNSAMTGLRLLRDAGVKVGLDDFGTGYSSLSYLRLLPLDFVKIDQSFIRELAVDATDRAIVGSIIDLSQALGMSVVAEGVETRAQHAELVALGCDRAQGYFYAAAGSPEAIEESVLRRPLVGGVPFPGDSA